MKIDWKRKLSSRKFWACIIGFITPVLLGFGVANDAVTQITAIISSAGCLIAYILSEGYVDANRNDDGGGDNGEGI